MYYVSGARWDTNSDSELPIAYPLKRKTDLLPSDNRSSNFRPISSVEGRLQRPLSKYSSYT
jgi:hypothetical protein